MADSESSLKQVAECLYRMPSSGRYYGQKRVGGKLIRQSFKTKDRKVAERKLRKFLTSAVKLDPVKKRWTFDHAYNEWFKTLVGKASSREQRQWHVKAIYKLWPQLSVTEIREITESDCQRWFAKRRPDISAQLLNNEMGTLKMIFKYGVQEGVIMENPAAILKREKVPKNTLIIPTKIQFAALVQHLRSKGNAKAADFVELLGYSGMRRDEAASFCWEDIDFEKGHFVITGGKDRTKNLDHRTIPLFPALKSFLERLKDGSESLKGNVLKVRQCRDAIKAACIKLGIPHFNHHSMRHFFCSNAVEHGIDFKTLAMWLGHKDGGLLVAKTYSHLRDEHSKAMAAKMTFQA